MSTDTDLAAAVSAARRMVENPIGLHGWAVNLARCFLSLADRDPVATISVPDRRDERTERAMIDAKKRVYEVAARLFGDGVCCTDHGCVFGHPGGMGTNGGCQHIKERDGTDLRRTVQKLAAVARALATADLTARVDKVRDESGPAPGWELVDPSRKKYGRVGGLTNKAGTWADYDDEHGYAPHVAAARAELATTTTPNEAQMTKRTIVTLCGSTRFYPAFQRANYEETMAGRIVLSVGFYAQRERGDTGERKHGESIGCTPAEKLELDRLHFDKIAMSDEILVLNVGGYVGESTRNEVAYGLMYHKRIRWLEGDGDAWLDEHADDIRERITAHVGAGR